MVRVRLSPIHLAAIFGAVLLAACGSPPVATHPSAAASSSPSPTPCDGLAAGTRAFPISTASASYSAREQITNDTLRRVLNLVGIDNVAVGRTDAILGEIDLGRDFSITRVDVTADIKSLKSDSDLRDQRIREQFLESNRFPKAHFVARSIVPVQGPYTLGQSATFQAPGELTVRDQTKPFVFNVEGAVSVRRSRARPPGG